MAWEKVGNIKGPQGIPGLLGIQRTRLLTNANGVVEWTFPTPFDTPPRILCTVESAGALPYLWTITVLSETGVTIQIRQGRTLPAVLLLLSALVSYNVFAGPDIENIPVHIIAVAAA